MKIKHIKGSPWWHVTYRGSHIKTCLTRNEATQFIADHEHFLAFK